MTGAPSVLVRCLAAQLEVQLVRANELAEDHQRAIESIKQADAAVKLAHEKFSTLAALNAAMHETIEAVRSVADNSSGIAGWHLNGDIATWEEILPEINDIETTATEAFLAEIRAEARNEGINYTASRLAAAFNHGFINKSLREVFDVTRMILSAKEELANEPHPIDGLSGEYAEKSLEEWEEQIRKGVQS
nr:hypothetical protein [Escherichia coli]